MDVEKDTPTEELRHEIQYRFYILSRQVAELTAAGNVGICCRLKDFQEPMIDLISLASLNLKFAEDVEKPYDHFLAVKNTRIHTGTIKHHREATLDLWYAVVAGLRDHKILVLAQEE